MHITTLGEQNAAVKKMNDFSLEDKEALQKEVLAASDYIVEV